MKDFSAIKLNFITPFAQIGLDSANPREDFLHTLSRDGFVPPQPLRDGILDRIKAPGDKVHKKSGWYVYNQYENFAIGIYGNWKGEPERVVWTSKSESSLSIGERTKLNEQIKEVEARRKEEERKRQAEASEEALKIWQSLPNADGSNPYLTKKCVYAYAGVKADADVLVVPVTLNDKITSLQRIYPDSNKRFMSGGRTKGCYFCIAGSDDVVYLAEGYATAASIHEATGATVYISFSAHNLYEVAGTIRELHQKIIICGDNDDTCRAKVDQIKQVMGIEAIFPPNDYNDFNDWAVADKAGLKAFFSKKPKVYKASIATLGCDAFAPHGVLQKITDFYNATSGNDQPLFAIQAALTATSTILGRNFTTNYGNRSSLYLMNIGKSATGKEHAKRVVEQILSATGNAHLINGDGYTSASAVVSALQERPRHFTGIDEFSKYLQASQNRNSGGHLAEANAALMQAIGRLDGTMRARSYASIGLSKDKKKELSNQFVHAPAITLLAMTTPDDFFNSISAGAVKDGFINRFIVCISDAERALRKHKEQIDVPESIVDWELAIRERKGEDLENPMIHPKTMQLDFTFDAMRLQEEFQQYCIDKANELEEFGLEEMVGRSNEMAMRIALIVALSRNPWAEKIEREDIQQGINWIKFNMERSIAKLKMSVSSSEHEAAKKEILRALRSIGAEGISWSAMQKRPPFSKYKAQELKEILTSLRDAELANDQTIEHGGAGRPGIRWIALA